MALLLFNLVHIVDDGQCARESARREYQGFLCTSLRIVSA